MLSTQEAGGDGIDWGDDAALQITVLEAGTQGERTSLESWPKWVLRGPHVSRNKQCIAKIGLLTHPAVFSKS